MNMFKKKELTKETDSKLRTLVTGINIKDKYEEDNGEWHLPDVFYGLKEDSYDWSIALSTEQVEAIKSFRNKDYFTQEEAHDIIQFLIEKCYEFGAKKNY